MKTKKLVMGIMMLWLSTLVLACNQDTETNISTPLPELENRPVATTYRTNTETKCYQQASKQANIIATLPAGRLVDLVSLQGANMRSEGILWLHVYPRLSHRPSCYIETRNLVPVE
jgi:hypothetical protein